MMLTEMYSHWSVRAAAAPPTPTPTRVGGARCLTRVDGWPPTRSGTNASRTTCCTGKTGARDSSFSPFTGSDSDTGTVCLRTFNIACVFTFLCCRKRICHCCLLPLVDERPRNRLVRLRDGFVLTSVRAATQRKKMQIKLSISRSHSILTLGQPVPALTL